MERALLFTANKPSILIIDDDSSILCMFTRIFQRKGYLVDVASKGSEAIQKMQSKCFDVALIDFRLPDMEGSELFPIIQRASPKTVKIMLTGNIHLLKDHIGADALLGKPVNPQKLLSVIDSKLKDRAIDY